MYFFQTHVIVSKKKEIHSVDDGRKSVQYALKSRSIKQSSKMEIGRLNYMRITFLARVVRTHDLIKRLTTEKMSTTVAVKWPACRPAAPAWQSTN